MKDEDTRTGCGAILIGFAALAASIAVGIAFGPAYGFGCMGLMAFAMALAVLRS